MRSIPVIAKSRVRDGDVVDTTRRLPSASGAGACGQQKSDACRIHQGDAGEVDGDAQRRWGAIEPAVERA
jgi:hypothetical protein